MVEYVPGAEPWSEEYWRALMEQGEQSPAPAPPPDSGAVWMGLGMMVGQPASVSQPPPSNGKWEAALEAMEEAAVLHLDVVNHNRGGLLVEWNGLQGFVPVSHLMDFPPYLDERQRAQELKNRVGQTLHLRIIEVDPQRRRLVLSERATSFDEAHRRELLDSLQPGDVRRGHVTNICSFGAFIDLGGVEGLVHVSEISWGRVEHPSAVLHPGQEVVVSVLNIDKERGRVGLSIKRTLPDPWRGIEKRYHIDQIIEGTITNVVDFGAFAEVEEGVEGLIHVSELADGHFLHPRNVVQKGQRMRMRVVSVDSTRRRLGLSLRRVPQPSKPAFPASDEQAGAQDGTTHQP